MKLVDQIFLSLPVEAYHHTMAEKRKLFCLTSEQKKEICVYHTNNSTRSQQDIATLFSEKFGQPVSRRTVGDIIANKEKCMRRDVSNDSKKIRSGQHSNLETVLQLWFATARSQNAVITDAVLREKAKQFGNELGITGFQYSNGWLQRFKTRYGISSKVMYGESAGVDPGVIAKGKEQAQRVIKDFALSDVYNLDETGLFFRMLPDRSLTAKDNVHGVKKPKDRISVMLCCNADGSDKLRPLVIGKNLKPRCFKHFNPQLYCDYYANNKAWMVYGILQDFLKKFNRRMVSENRHILLLMDNAPSHVIPENLTHIRCEFLPPTTTSHLQPLDAGIISAFKFNYRRYLVRFHVDAIDAGRKPKVEINDAIRWTKLSWDEVTENCIKNCWRHTGILPAISSVATVVDTQSTATLYRDFGNIFERLAIPAELMMTPAEYVDVDNDITTCEVMTDAEILQLVSNGQAAGGSEENVDTVEEIQEVEEESDHISNDQAAAAVDTLMRFFEQSDRATSDDIQKLCLIKRRVDCLRSSSLKQSSILNFFSRQ